MLRTYSNILVKCKAAFPYPVAKELRELIKYNCEIVEGSKVLLFFPRQSDISLSK